jgi:hypothetical protein
VDDAEQAAMMNDERRLIAALRMANRLVCRYFHKQNKKGKPHLLDLPFSTQN